MQFKTVTFLGQCKILSENATSDHQEDIYISGALTETQRMKGKAAREVARMAVKRAINTNCPSEQ